MGEVSGEIFFGAVLAGPEGRLLCGGKSAYFQHALEMKASGPKSKPCGLTAALLLRLTYRAV